VQNPVLANFRMPDREGGEDYFAAQRGNPANFDSVDDIDFLSGTADAKIYSAGGYQDSINVSHIGDYFEAINKAGEVDPVNAFVFNETAHPIDASRYKIFCYNLDILRANTAYHSVARVIWFRDGAPGVSEDLINQTNGETRHCLRLDTVEREAGTSAWANNSNGTGIDHFRLDAHEEAFATRYRIADARLASDHESNDRYAVVIGGNRDKAVDVTYTSTAGSGSVGSLPANRQSDVLLWNTSGLAEGTYTLHSQIDGFSFDAHTPIIVSHTANATDASVPVLQVLAPLNGHRFSTTLELTGYAVDNRKLAAVEALLDNSLIASFLPTDFDKDFRDTYSTFPYASSARFQKLVDVSGLGLADGNHTLTINTYDTAGNLTTFSSTVVKAGDNLTSPLSFSTPASGAFTVPSGARDRNPNARLILGVTVSGHNLNYTLSGGASCSSIKLIANANGPKAALVRKRGTLLSEITTNKGNVLGTSTGVPSLKTKLRKVTVYVLADCIGNPKKSRVFQLNVKKIKGKPQTTALKSIIRKMKSTFRRQ
jgi:hypothetical protein